MRIKLPLVLFAATQQPSVPPTQQGVGRMPPHADAIVLKAGASGDQAASESDLLRSIWTDAAAMQRKEMGGKNTVDIVGARNITGTGLDGALDDLMERIEATGWDNRLIMVPKMGGKELVGLGPLSKAYIMELYEQKYGITLGSVVYERPAFEAVGEAEGTISDESLNDIVDKLKTGRQAGIIIVDRNHGHSAAVILQADPDAKKFKGVSLDSMPTTNDAYDYEMALAPITDALGMPIEMLTGSDVIAQRDASSCNTMSCVLARDVLRDDDSNFVREFGNKSPAPKETMKTAQWDGYLKKNNLDPKTILNPETQRTYGDHRDDHSASVGGKVRHHYLMAKTLQYAERTLDWLDSLSGNEERVAAGRQLLEKAYPGNEVIELLEGKSKKGEQYEA